MTIEFPTSFESAWRAGRPAFGGWITSGSAVAVGAYESAGFDYVAIDCQHTLTDEAAAAKLLVRVNAGTATFARASENSEAPIGKLLDAGARGVIVPGIDSAEEAAAAVAACYYPPAGRRSYGPLRQDIGATIKELSSRALCFPMIETTAGLANLDAICAVPGVAGVYVGPVDLSIALGLPETQAFTSNQLDDTVSVVRAACERAGIVLGIHADGVASAQRWERLGARFVSIGGDAAILRNAAADVARQVIEPVRP